MPKQPPQTAKDDKVVYKTVRVPSDAYELAHELLTQANRDGWQKFGIKRTDSPTLGTLIHEGLKSLKSK